MDTKLRRLVAALGPTMPPTAAEVCLRATAICARKPVDMLGAEDLPAIEAAVRDALSPVASSSSIELTILKVREMFLDARSGADC